MADNYSKRELDMKFEALKSHIDDKMKPICEKVDKVLVKLDNQENEIENLKIWRAYITGGIAVLTALVVPILIAFVKGHLSF